MIHVNPESGVPYLTALNAAIKMMETKSFHHHQQGNREMYLPVEDFEEVHSIEICDKTMTFEQIKPVLCLMRRCYVNGLAEGEQRIKAEARKLFGIGEE